MTLPRPVKTAFAVIDAFADVARPFIRQRYAINSCIASTRIAIDVFAHFDLKAEPRQVVLYSHNSAMVEKLRHHPIPSRKLLDRWHRETGAHDLAVGSTAGPLGPNEWPGHLVAVVEEGWLVDASADQASRPQHNMPLPDVLIAEAPREFVAGKKPLILKFPEGTIVIYKPVPEGWSFKATPGWWPTDTSRDVTAQIIRAVEAQLRVQRAV